MPNRGPESSRAVTRLCRPPRADHHGLDAATKHQSRSRPAAAWCGSRGCPSTVRRACPPVQAYTTQKVAQNSSNDSHRSSLALRTPRASRARGYTRRVSSRQALRAGIPPARNRNHNSEITSIMPAGSAVWGAATSLRRQHCYLQLGRQGHPRGRRRRGPRGKAPQESRRHRQCSVRRAVRLARTREPLDTRVGDANLLQ